MTPHDPLWAELVQRAKQQGPRYSEEYGRCPLCRLTASHVVPLGSVWWAVCAPCRTRWWSGASFPDPVYMPADDLAADDMLAPIDAVVSDGHSVDDDLDDVEADYRFALAFLAGLAALDGLTSHNGRTTMFTRPASTPVFPPDSIDPYQLDVLVHGQPIAESRLFGRAPARHRCLSFGAMCVVSARPDMVWTYSNGPHRHYRRPRGMDALVGATVIDETGLTVNQALRAGLTTWTPTQVFEQLARIVRELAAERDRCAARVQAIDALNLPREFPEEAEGMPCIQGNFDAVNRLTNESNPWLHQR